MTIKKGNRCSCLDSNSANLACLTGLKDKAFDGNPVSDYLKFTILWKGFHFGSEYDGHGFDGFTSRVRKEGAGLGICTRSDGPRNLEARQILRDA